MSSELRSNRLVETEVRSLFRIKTNFPLVVIAFVLSKWSSGEVYEIDGKPLSFGLSELCVKALSRTTGDTYKEHF